ncbi:pyridoxal kinase-like protein [Basidiobolus meristosporus CBS 931.73]|uniref:pyridoxal kinase n=1 Tax=Basidiobolus meristosporus CBS 931.73 TaxID=1314790 RepID=A0A1Y1X494_9FUNG|nr:pyridoxal kinase-like protein [Basidiobolus meristosporus CBS 931.73]|eukprot:ORX80637.1 pyridoxal kinase-like protein [Basidiobolus meristosporus CBS 931.73]
MTGEDRRVLCIQSHVVHGYVGNKSAVFPLQLLGFDVDNLNTVQFSNHTGYPSWSGQRLTSEELWEAFKGIEINGLEDYTHLLTGYLGNSENLRVVAKILKKLREKNPNLIYVLDPVLGDNGKFYIPEEAVPIYRDELAKQANVITPNQFEAECLTGLKINTLRDVHECLDRLHDLGIEHVVITSCQLSDTPKDTLILYGSQRRGSKVNQFSLQFPQLDGYFTGTGDVLAALILAHLQKESEQAVEESLTVACEKGIATMIDILARTVEEQKKYGITSKPTTATNVRRCELRLIQSKGSIEHPKVRVRATKLGP